MKSIQKIGFVLVLILVCNSLFSSNVALKDVRIVAENYYQNQSKSIGATGAIAYSLKDKNNNSILHVVNVNSKGFVLVAGNDEIKPILGYSNNGIYNPNDVPVQLQDLLNLIKKGIVQEVNDGNPASSLTQTLWLQAKSGSFPTAKSNSVAPLTTTEWNQWPRYNKFCPGGAPTGCVATAVAQIMKYHNHPVQGKGDHSYTHPDHGTLSANFGATTYDWSNMPNKLSSSNSLTEIDAVATLNFHIGVSLDMDYGPNGSSTYSHKVDNALEDYFHYKNTATTKYRYSYSLTGWKNLLKSELDQARVVYHSGFCPDPQAGHAFVIDGYDTDDLFHVNWGWGGAYNGYFEINNLNPGSTYTWNQSQSAIIGIEPLPMTMDLQFMGDVLFHTDSVYNDTLLVLDSITNIFDTLFTPIVEHLDTLSFDSTVIDTLGLNAPFSLTATVGNWGNVLYNGQFMAAICDLNNNIVDTIDITDSMLVSPFNYSGVHFNSGSKNLMPGNYKIAIFWEDAGSWQLVDQGVFYNAIEFHNSGGVTQPNGILAFSEIIINPDPLFQDEAFSVEIVVKNNQNTNWSGLISADFHETNGDWIDEINSTYKSLSPYQTDTIHLTSSQADMALGAYKIAFWNQPSNGSWELIKSGYYKNNRETQVVAKEYALIPDDYEDNNSSENAYVIEVSNFTNDHALIYTNGTNLHNDNDEDYFRLTFDDGYSYQVTPILYDASAPNSPKEFSLDAVIAYGINTEANGIYYDNEEIGTLILNGEGYIEFHIAPFFAELLGTYMLHFSIERFAPNKVDESVNVPNLNVYPSPNAGFFFIDGLNAEDQIEIIDASGSLVKALQNEFAERQISVDLTGDITPGLYFVRISSPDKQTFKRFVVK
jgi:hypothetical protein